MSGAESNPRAAAQAHAARAMRVMLPAAAIVLLASVVFAVIHTNRYGDWDAVIGGGLPLLFVLLGPPIAWLATAGVTRWTSGRALFKALLVGTLAWIALAVFLLYPSSSRTPVEMAVLILGGALMNALLYVLFRVSDARGVWLQQMVVRIRSRKVRPIPRWIGMIALFALVLGALVVIWLSLQQYLSLIEMPA